MANISPAVLPVSFLMFTLIFAFVGIRMFGRKREVKRRLNELIAQSSAAEEGSNRGREAPQPKTMARRLLTYCSQFFAGITFAEAWKDRLARANVRLKVEEFYALRAAVTVCCILVCFLLEFPLAGSIAIGLFCWFWLPSFVLRRRQERRLVRCDTQLAAALGTMANATRAGFSFMQAMQMIGKEMPDPLGPEFEQTMQEVNLGIPLEEAFRNLLNRLPHRDLELVTSAILIQRSTGGNLADLLETMRDTIHGRIRAKEELRTLTAQGRISAMIITLLPIALAMMIQLINPGFFDPMFTELLGWVLLAGGAVSGLTGWFFIRKIVRIEG